MRKNINLLKMTSSLQDLFQPKNCNRTYIWALACYKLQLPWATLLRTLRKFGFAKVWLTDLFNKRSGSTYMHQARRPYLTLILIAFTITLIHIYINQSLYIISNSNCLRNMKFGIKVMLWCKYLKENYKIQQIPLHKKNLQQKLYLGFVNFYIWCWWKGPFSCNG